MPLQVSENEPLLHPPIEPYKEHYLEVSKKHTLYVEESGNPQGLPVIFLHGGPGGRSHPSDRRYFNPKDYRIILYDQRGSGKSSPFASIEDNTPQDLIEDLEKIRSYLGISKWVLFGGSWGSTLALLYGLHYPEKSLGFILRGLFLGSQAELEWFYEGKGANLIYPEAWENFYKLISKSKNTCLIDAYYEILSNEKHPLFHEAVNAWALWEGRALSLTPKKETLNAFLVQKYRYSLAKIECHFFKHKLFLEEDFFWKNLDKISKHPLYLIHGRYDIICPLGTAWKLHKKLPLSELFIVENAGHTISEYGLTEKAVQLTQELFSKIS